MSKVNAYRLTLIITSIASIGQWLDGVRNWRSPAATVLVHALFLVLVRYPSLILPATFFCLFIIGVWNYQFRLRRSPHIDTSLSCEELANAEDLDEEFDTDPTTSPFDIVRARMRITIESWQKAIGGLATRGERLQAVVS